MSFWISTLDFCDHLVLLLYMLADKSQSASADRLSNVAGHCECLTPTVHLSLLTVYHPPSTFHRPPYYPPSTIHRLPSPICHSMPPIHRLPSIIYHPLSTMRCLPSTVYHPPSIIQHTPWCKGYWKTNFCSWKIQACCRKSNFWISVQ